MGWWLVLPPVSTFSQMAANMVARSVVPGHAGQSFLAFSLVTLLVTILGFYKKVVVIF